MGFTSFACVISGFLLKKSENCSLGDGLKTLELVHPEISAPCLQVMLLSLKVFSCASAASIKLQPLWL